MSRLRLHGDHFINYWCILSTCQIFYWLALQTLLRGDHAHAGRNHFHGSTNDDFLYSFLTFWKKKKKKSNVYFAHYTRTFVAAQCFPPKLGWNFFFLLLNNIFGTVYLISFNLFILYTVLYIYIYILIYVFVQLMFLIKIS